MSCYRQSIQRQPPAPPRRPQCRRDGSLMVDVTDPHLNIVMANKEEGKSEMIERKRHENTIGSPPYYFRRCKKQKRLITNIECLPDDLVFKILVNLPAQDIYNAAMLVCRNWYRMVHTDSFIYAHFHHSPPGLLFFDLGCAPCFTSVAIRQGRIERYKFPQFNVSRVLYGFNGLLLVKRLFRNHLHITNPITGQEFAIPPHLEHVPLPPENFHPSLGYSPSTMEYKVVFWHEVATDNLLKCFILTPGVDNSWRDFCTQHISNSSFFLQRAKLTQGFMHWYSDTHVWTLNLETEILTQTPVPPDVINSYYLFDAEYSLRSTYYLSTTGKSLSVLVWLSQLCWDIWEMRSETGEWTKVGLIDLEAQRRRLERIHRSRNELDRDTMLLAPGGWLEYKEVLMFMFDTHFIRGNCITYNVRTQEVDSFELGHESATHLMYLHTNSLEWLAP